MRTARAGHIPSAINIDWEENIQGNSFKTKKELAKLYSKIPINSQVVTYCQGGYRAAHSFIALKILGFKNVKMDLGSWGEWGNRSRIADRKIVSNVGQHSVNYSCEHVNVIRRCLIFNFNVRIYFTLDHHYVFIYTLYFHIHIYSRPLSSKNLRV